MSGLKSLITRKNNPTKKNRKKLTKKAQLIFSNNQPTLRNTTNKGKIQISKEVNIQLPVDRQVILQETQIIGTYLMKIQDLSDKISTFISNISATTIQIITIL